MEQSLILIDFRSWYAEENSCRFDSRVLNLLLDAAVLRIQWVFEGDTQPMGLAINTNLPALGVGRETARTSGLLARTLQQLASGRRINRAADDASGLAIADQLDALARQSQTEINSLQSGINALQTADSGLQSQGDALQRIRELAVQASNGTLSQDQRDALNAEAQQLVQQIDSAAENTEFNGQNLLNQTTTISVTPDGNQQVNIQQSNAASLGVDTLDLSSQAGAQSALEQIDSALESVSDNRSNLGAQTSGFESAIETRSESLINARSSESAIRDLDFARAAIEKARADVLGRAGISALLQTRINPQNTLRLLGNG